MRSNTTRQHYLVYPKTNTTWISNILFSTNHTTHLTPTKSIYHPTAFDSILITLDSAQRRLTTFCIARRHITALAKNQHLFNIHLNFFIFDKNSQEVLDIYGNNCNARRHSTPPENIQHQTIQQCWWYPTMLSNVQVVFFLLGVEYCWLI